MAELTISNVKKERNSVSFDVSALSGGADTIAVPYGYIENVVCTKFTEGAEPNITWSPQSIAINGTVGDTPHLTLLNPR